MHRFVFVSLFSLLLNVSLLANPPQTISSSNVYEKASKLKILSELRLGIETKKWKEVCTLLKNALHKHTLSFHDMKTLSKAYPGSPFARAIDATKNIMSLPEKTGLTESIVLPIALFAETYLQDEIIQGHLYFPKSMFARACQYDPETGRFFIHLETNGVKAIGEGKSKVVTKSILYDAISPEICAHGVTAHDVENEVFAMRELRGVPGVIEAISLLSNTKHKSKTTITGIVTPIYNQGSLFSFLEKSGSSLTFRERLGIAKDLITGLDSMHSRQFVHRDLGVKNHFINIEKASKSKRKITAVIADLGRTLPVSEAKGHYVQGNAFYLCPEGFFQSKMKGKDYYASDVFAMGCVFWQLYFNKLPNWSPPRYFKKEEWSIKKRYHAHLALLKRTRKPYSTYLNKKKAQKKSLTTKDKFLQLILKMTHPKPKARGTASSLKARFSHLDP